MLFGNKLKQILAFAIVLTLLYNSGFAQSKRATKDIYGDTLCSYIDEDKNVYFRENGEKILVYKFGTMFNGGQEPLAEFLDSTYYNNPKFDGREYHTCEYFYILFNKNLEIIEVRISQGNREKDTYYYFDSIFIDALKNTTGMWHKTVENQEWYLLICPYYFH